MQNRYQPPRLYRWVLPVSILQVIMALVGLAAAAQVVMFPRGGLHVVVLVFSLSSMSILAIYGLQRARKWYRWPEKREEHEV